MVRVSLAFFAGTLLAFLCPASTPHWAAVASAAVAVFCAFAQTRRLMSARSAGGSLFAAWSLAAGLCAGLAWELFSIGGALDTRWPANRNDERVLVTAQMDGLTTRRSVGLAFDAWIVPAVHPGPLPDGRALHARLLWRDAPGIQPHACETWQLLVTLHAPTAAVNPGAADGERQLFRDQIDAQGTIVASSRLNKRIAARERCLNAWRERSAAHIRRVVDDRDAGSLIAALAVGATGEMSADQWRIFAATGTTHLVAISGSHVTMFALAAMLIARWLWRFTLCGHAPIGRESFAAAFGLAAATAYAALAGLSVPTLRTLLMLAAWQLGVASARSVSALAPFCAALVAILLLDPFAALSSGFWLSFVAIAVIGLLSAEQGTARGSLLTSVRLQAALFIALAPLTLAWFGSLSLAGLIVNAAAIPAIGWVLVPLVLAALAIAPVSISVSDLLFQLAARLCVSVWPAMEWIASGPLAQLHAQPPAWWILVACAAGAVVLLPWPRGLRLSVLASAIALAIPLARPRPGAVEVTVLDVGDGTAVIARTAGHALTYGLGDRMLGDGGSVDHVLVPFLQSVGVQRVDLAVLGRASAHGSPGLTALLADIQVDRVGLPDGVPLDFPHAERCARDSRWEWDGVLFETRAAAAGCVVRIAAGGRSIALAGEGIPLATLPVSDAVVLRSAAGREGAATGPLRIISAKHPLPRAAGLSTGGSGAMQLIIDPSSAAHEALEWRARFSGPWRTVGSGYDSGE